MQHARLSLNSSAERFVSKVASKRAPCPASRTRILPDSANEPPSAQPYPQSTGASDLDSNIGWIRWALARLGLASLGRTTRLHARRWPNRAHRGRSPDTRGTAHPLFSTTRVSGRPLCPVSQQLQPHARSLGHRSRHACLEPAHDGRMETTPFLVSKSPGRPSQRLTPHGTGLCR